MTIERLYKVNQKLKLENGLYVASLGEEYVDFCWIRDIYYQALPDKFLNPKGYEQTYHTLLDYMIGLEEKYDNKISWLIKNPRPINTTRFIHPRFNKDLSEITSEWGNIQLDAIGYFLLGIAEGVSDGLNIVRNLEDVKIIQKIINMLEAISYHTVKDNGAWEEYSEIHASSIGAIAGGLIKLKEVAHICHIQIPSSLISKGMCVLNSILPNESATKHVDLALLTLIYPFNVVTPQQRDKILDNVEKYLLRNNGVIRYIGDEYYNNCKDNQPIGSEMEWSFGLAYLSIIYSQMGDKNKAQFYLDKILKPINKDTMYIPEGYYSNTNDANPNIPLGWSVALAIIASIYINKKEA